MEKNTMNELASQGTKEPIYSRTQVVYVKSKDKEERHRELRVTIDLHTGVGPLGRQVLNLELTDDDDPYFLYSLLITTEDFKGLKVEQGLLVDFDQFPSQLVRLLEECAAGRDRTGSRFHLILNEDSVEPRKVTNLQFVETNEFKHLCHLSLRVIPGSDNEVKKHMSLKLKHLKDELLNTSNLLEKKDQMLTVAREKLECQNRELEELRLKMGEERSSLERRLMQESSEAREALSKAHLEWQRQLERERQESEDIRLRDTKCLEEQISELKSRNHILSDKQRHTELTFGDTAKQLGITERDLKNARKEITKLQKQNSKIDLDYHEKEKQLVNIRTRVAVLEQELKDQILLMDKHRELHQKGEEQKARYEEALACKDEVLRKERETLANISADLTKANKIITKLMKDNQDTRTKLEVVTEIVKKQESKLTSQVEQCGELSAKITTLETQISSLERARQTAEEALVKATQELENKEKMLKAKEEVITYLTRDRKETEANNFYGTRSGLGSSSLPATSTPNVGGAPVPNAGLPLSAVQSYDSELFRSQQIEHSKKQAEIRKRLGLPESVLSSDKPKSMAPLQEEVDDPGVRLRPSGSGRDTRDQQTRVKVPISTRPTRPAPTATTPAVARSNLLDAYKRRS